MTATPGTTSRTPGRAEVVAALSLGLDLGLGQPMEHMLRAAVIATRLADRLGADSQLRATVYYSELIAWIGCHADSPEVTALFRDEIGFRSGIFHVDMKGPSRARFLLGHSASGRPLLEKGYSTASFMLSGHRRMVELVNSHYASAGALADRLGLGEHFRTAVHHTFERWDGTGLPRGIGGSDIPPAMRIVALADVVEVHFREGGAAAAVLVAKQRSGTQFDPEIVTAFTDGADEILDDLGGDAWQAAMLLAPATENALTETELDDLLVALGDFVDLKSGARHGHSRAVSALAGGAAVALGLAPDLVLDLRRAGALHDLGRLGVSNTIWEKPTPLTAAERERIRMYPYLTTRILSRINGFGSVAALAGTHRERLDGSGYPQGVAGAGLSVASRVLMAADRFQSLSEPRRYRPAMSVAQAADSIRREAQNGLLDPAVVEAVLSTEGLAGSSVPAARVSRSSGLTPREETVLALAAVGRTSREIAVELTISAKTVRNHLEHIYAKAGVSNRASASLFAVQHGIIPPRA